MNIALVVFDLAGTTVKDNKDVHRVLQQVLEKNEVPVSLEETNDVMGIPKPVAIKQLLLKNYVGPREITMEWIEDIHHEFITNMIAFYQTDAQVEEKENASSTFRALRDKNIKVVVNTGFDRKITNALLDRLGWTKNSLIDGSVTSDEVYFGRPFPDMIYKAMDLVGVRDSQHVAKVGDTTSDLMEGLNAGCGYVIGVTTGAHSRDKLMEHYHTHLIDNLDELVPILTRESLVAV